MKHLVYKIGLTSLFLVGTLGACTPSTPVADAIKDKVKSVGSEEKAETGTETDPVAFENISKAQYMALLDCYGADATSSGKAVIAGARLVAESVSDDKWSETVSGIGGLSMKNYYNLAIKKGCSI